MKRLLFILAILVCGASVLTACMSIDDNAVTKDDSHAKKALLIVLDGWGIVYQDLVKINRACADNSILENPEIKAAYSYAKSNGKSLHLMGLTSTGGVHSSLDHLLKLIDIAKEYDIQNCYVHCFMDGRDTDPRAGKGFIADLQQHINQVGTGAIASVIGRFYAMDRDKNWDRIKLAYDLLVDGKGREVSDMAMTVIPRSKKTPTSSWSRSSTATSTAASARATWSSSSTSAATAQRN